MSLPCSHDSFTLPNQRDNVRQYNADTLVIFAMPTYAGRLPNKALPFLQSLFHGNATPAAAIVTFGNRSYDSSLAELVEDIKQGFYPSQLLLLQRAMPLPTSVPNILRQMITPS